MRYSLIDMGSNSLRLTVYQVRNGVFRALFKTKEMAGLAGYVEDGRLSRAGIERACEALALFQCTLKDLGINKNIYVFATASLRNISNPAETLAAIREKTGLTVDILSGQEEALLGYAGVMQELSFTNGAFIDIGGASTELVIFRQGVPMTSESYKIGSLRLYKDCVNEILPDKTSLKKLSKAIRREFTTKPPGPGAGYDRLICTGGTSRAIFKYARRQGLIDADGNTMDMPVLDSIGRDFLSDKKAVADTILKLEPARIHTIIPGYMILRYAARRLAVQKLTVSTYGVREGYLCQKIIRQSENTAIRKTER